MKASIPSTAMVDACLAPSMAISPRLAEEAEIIHLLKREVCSILLAEGEEIRIVVASGVAWVTMEGDPEDHVLSGGEGTRLPGPGRLVIESLEGELLARVVCQAKVLS